MPSMLHEALVDLFRNRPDLAPKVLKEALDVEVPEYDEVREESIDFTQIIPTEYRADLVILLFKGQPVFAIVVEVQLSSDDRKRLSWPVYVTTLRARFNCPACLLVVAPTESVAKWCAEPIEIGHEGFVLEPYVLGPEGVPVITDEKEAKASPEMAVISVIAHGKGEHGLKVAAAALAAAAGLDDEHALFYTDLILHALSKAARRALEALMRLENYEYQSEFARKYFGQGKTAGIAEGKAESILANLEGRDIPVSEEQRRTILACRDLKLLDRWLRRSLSISQAEELFDS